MSEILTTPSTWVHVVGYLLATLLPAWPLARLSTLTWRILAFDEGVPRAAIDRHHRWDLPFLVGALERILYVASWLVAKPEFVGVWLLLKVAGGWKAWTDGQAVPWTNHDGATSSRTVSGRHLLNVFLIGTALSLLNGFTWAMAIQWYVASDRARAVLVTAIVTFVTCAIWLWHEWRWRSRAGTAVRAETNLGVETAMADNNAWYRQSLYEQSWENYRNEDENFRGTIWQYLVFAAGIVYAASQAQAATRLMGALGVFISGITAFYSLRINLYSHRWLVAKESAAPEAASELEHLKEAKKHHGLAFIPGWLLALAFPITGLVLFFVMLLDGKAFWS